MYLLDTNICIYIIKKKPVEVLKRFQQIEVGHVGISSITLSELIFGAQKSGYPAKNFKALEMFTAALRILDYDARAAYFYGEIRQDLQSKGTPIGPMDTLIAAHAASENHILITNNEKEFRRVAGLRVENWVSWSKHEE